LKPGTSYVYKGQDAGAPQTDRVVVTHKTKTIMGVKCVVVLDTVSTSGTPVERTFDWYTQDKAGNVWYFGEDSRDFRGGRWVVSSGSWQAGVDGAKPGIIMPARLRPGKAYRQEFYPGHAEDMGSVVGFTRSMTVPYGSFKRVLVTREWTPLEPGIVERKYYARGLGQVGEETVTGGSETMRLVTVEKGAA
jgi:hypothetical protein